MPSFRGASQAASSAASSTCAKPPGTVDGDILIAFHAVDNGVFTSMTAPTGGTTWLLLDQRQRVNTSQSGTKIWWKVAGASEPSTYGIIKSSSGDGAVSIIAVSDASTATPVIAQNGGTTATTTVSTPSTTPPTGAGDFEVRCVALFVPGAARTWTPPAGFTERTDVQASALWTSTTTATRTLSAGGATGTADFTASGTVSEYHGFTVNLGPPSTPVTLADSGAAGETLTVAVTAPLGDTAAAADAGAGARLVTLTDTAAGDAPPTAGASLILGEAGTAADAFGLGTPKPVADGGTAADTVVVAATLTLAQAGTAADALQPSAAVPLSQTGSATDTLTGALIVPKTLTDTGAGVDSAVRQETADLKDARPPYRGWAVEAPERDWKAAGLRAGYPGEVD